METLPSLFEVKEVDRHYRGFVPSIFVSACLPLRDTKNALFKRKYNNIELYLTGTPKVPYGKYARLILSVLTTHAVLNSGKGSVDIEYSNLGQLLDELQLPKQRGKEVREQLELFSYCTFQYREKIEKKIQGNLFEDDDASAVYNATWNNTGNIPFMKSLQWIDLEKISSGEKRSYDFKITLSQEFVELCAEHAVPIDYTVYSRINSALGKDLYAWLIYRNNYLKEGDELFLSKKNLIDQFMPVPQDAKNRMAQIQVNWEQIRERVTEIKMQWYPDLKVSIAKDNSGLTLRKSPNVITERDRRYILITS